MRYSIPYKMIHLLWEDSEFFNTVMKIGRTPQSKFPKNDQYSDEYGFHLEFALAGYSPSDINIEVNDGYLSVESNGLDDVIPEEPKISSEDDAFQQYSRPAKARVHTGIISRGIARRSFRVEYAVAPIFDCHKATAVMENGLLHITIPRRFEYSKKELVIQEMK